MTRHNRLRAHLAACALSFAAFFVGVEAGRAESAASAPAAATKADTPAHDDVVILLTSSGTHRFTVEIADDPIERARGLMFRQEMARDHGMLFDFGREDHQAFWMKNTPLSLDIIFIGGDGTVDSIAANTTPFSTDSIPSDGVARFVLEVNAGVAADIGLAPGDHILHRRVQR